MKRALSCVAVATFLAASSFGSPASDAQLKSSQSTVHGGFELRDGHLFSLKNHKIVSSPDEHLTQFTVSPDGRFVVFVRKEELNGSMWILNTKSGKRIQVGKDLDIGCCVLMSSIENKGFADAVSFVNGAFWTKKNEVLVATFEGKGGAMEFFLSMNGKLKGDV